MKELYITALVVLFYCSFFPPSWAEGKNEPDLLQTLFIDADIIQDQLLDKGEFDIFHFRSFNIMDDDMDGVLLIDECTEERFWPNLRRLYDRNNHTKNREIAQTIRKHEFIMMPQRFESIDKNGNGQLDLNEYISFGRTRFTYFDKNGNDMITAIEFCSGYQPDTLCDSTHASNIEPSSNVE